MHEPHGTLGSTDRLTFHGPQVLCTVGVHSWVQLVAFLTEEMQVSDSDLDEEERLGQRCQPSTSTGGASQGQYLG